jgi:hypothetical protein
MVCASRLSQGKTKPHSRNHRIAIISHINRPSYKTSSPNKYTSPCSAVSPNSFRHSMRELQLTSHSTSPSLRRRAQAARGPRLADCLRRSRDLRSALPLYVLGETHVVSCEMMRGSTFTNGLSSALRRRIRFQACVSSDFMTNTRNQRKRNCDREDRGCTNIRRSEASQGMRGKRVYITYYMYSKKGRYAHT